MNGNSFAVLDTNVMLYHLSDRINPPLQLQQHAISVITEIELLSYPSITAEEIGNVQRCIANVTVIDLLSFIKLEAIELRRKYRIKVPDAIIAATALWLERPLITNDKKLLGIPEIETRSIAI